ncbi:MAG: glycosyltransferase family 4 protein [Burkholderiales bacterium]|jgi:teichuronic acid biosynthesis glycosyltransferase TuaC|uniref:glycosyltransferase family 4 protein n=1 Tax=Roseateles sp. TaxID=1971397 RepID=UPI000FBA14F7|nr:MAG: glycosyltransferase family 4 protein [Burkholderiales bacterium]
MRLLTFSSLYPSSARPQHGLFVASRLRELRARHGFDAQVLAPVPWFPFTSPRFGDYAAWARTPAREDWQGQPAAHPRYLMLPIVGMHWQPDAMARAAAAWIEREGVVFDLIDAHYFYPDGVAAAALSQRYGKPLLITARGSDVNLIGQDSRARARMLDAASQASACIGVSQALVDVLQGWGVPQRKLHVVRNGVDLERFLPVDRRAARAELGLSIGVPLLLSVGNLFELKGHALLVDAVHELREELPALQLFIAGEGPERSRLQSQIERRGLAARVHLLGAIPNAQLGAWYNAADLFLLPSSREGLPNALLEALACGTPALASAVGGIPEVLGGSPEAGEVMPERTPQAIAAAIRRWLPRSPDRGAVRQLALGYSWEHSATQLAALMRAVVLGAQHA